MPKEKLASLTLEDKVGEMTQLGIDMLMVGAPYNLAKPNRLDTAKLKKLTESSYINYTK